MGEAKQLVGDKVCLCSNVDCGLLQMGNPEEAYLATKECIRKASKGGGHILMTGNVPMEVNPLKNYLAMMQALKDFGRYPIDL